MSNCVGLEKEDSLNRARWKVGVGEITAGQSGVNPATSVYGDKPGSKLDDEYDLICKIKRNDRNQKSNYTPLCGNLCLLAQLGQNTRHNPAYKTLDIYNQLNFFKKQYIPGSDNWLSLHYLSQATNFLYFQLPSSLDKNKCIFIYQLSKRDFYNFSHLVTNATFFCARLTGQLSRQSKHK